MASIVSLYSEAVSADVANDGLPSEPPVLSTITAFQDTNFGAIPEGRTQVTLNWALPTLNERLPGEFLGVADGLAQVFETVYDPIAASPVLELYETTGQAGGSTTLAAPAAMGDLSVEVTSPTSFNPNDWVELENGLDKEFAKIQSINGNFLNFFHRLRNIETWAAGSTTVKETQVQLKVLTTDYTVNPSTGEISLLAGQFLAAADVFTEYSVTLQDLDRFELYRIPGDMPVSEPALYADVIGHPDVVLVYDDIPSISTQVTEPTPSSINGETWTYYLFALDDEGTPNPSVADAVMIEMLTTIPQNLGKTSGDNQVLVGWDEILDDNFDGVNIYRCEGEVFNAPFAQKLNSSLVTGDVFDDSINNLLNRRPPEEVPYPVNGQVYTYQIESEDLETTWSVGTQNTSADGVEQLTASKAL